MAISYADAMHQIERRASGLESRRKYLKHLAIATALAVSGPAVPASLPAQIPVAAHPDEWIQIGNPGDAYWVDDNRWGKGTLTEGAAPQQYEQYVGGSTQIGANGEVAARFKWRWPIGTTEVKGYPSILAGAKPGNYAKTWSQPGGRPIRLHDGTIADTVPSGATPGTFFPLQLPIQKLRSKATFRHLVKPSGRGHLSWDIWLQEFPQQDHGFAKSSITHEIMIPLDSWGGYGVHPGRNPQWYDHDVVLEGRLFHVYATKDPDGGLRPHHGGLDGSYSGRKGWKMIVFEPDRFPIQGELNLATFVNYVATRKDALGAPWATGHEYMVSAELGVEPIEGAGDIVVGDFKVSNTDSGFAAGSARSASGRDRGTDR